MEQWEKDYLRIIKEDKERQKSKVSSKEEKDYIEACWEEIETPQGKIYRPKVEEIRKREEKEKRKQRKKSNAVVTAFALICFLAMIYPNLIPTAYKIITNLIQPQSAIETGVQPDIKESEQNDFSELTKTPQFDEYVASALEHPRTYIDGLGFVSMTDEYFACSREITALQNELVELHNAKEKWFATNELMVRWENALNKWYYDENTCIGSRKIDGSYTGVQSALGAFISENLSLYLTVYEHRGEDGFLLPADNETYEELDESIRDLLTFSVQLKEKWKEQFCAALDVNGIDYTCSEDGDGWRLNYTYQPY